MQFDPDKHHRRSIRLKEYDYSQSGAYFVTVCAWQKENIFGEIKNAKMLLNEYGRLVQEHWEAIPEHFDNVETDEFVIMPNHIHGIVSLSNVGAQFIAPFRKATTENQGVINHAPTVGEIFRAFKARCAHAINQIRNTTGVPLWQRNFYEHIIRSEDELNRTRQYIRENPARWESDDEYSL
ncbi:MAG: transposase [Nitrospirae bacterium]|nr:transposase [Nitrospirota bacterium]